MRSRFQESTLASGEPADERRVRRWPRWFGWLTPLGVLRLLAGFVVLSVVGILLAEVLSDATPVWTAEEVTEDAAAPAGTPSAIPDGFSPQAVAIDPNAGGIDARVATSVSTLNSGWWPDLARVLAGLGKIWFVIPLIAAFGWMGWRVTGGTEAFWVPALAMIGGFALSVSVKLVTFRPRPPADVAMVEAFGPSYPSGHAIRAAATYGAMAWLVSRLSHRVSFRLASWGTALVLGVAVGAARVVQGAHWVTDVLASYVLGAGWLVVILVATGLLTKREHSGVTSSAPPV